MELSRTIETETGEMIVKRVSVPLGLEELMEGLAKEVILKKPRDIYIFAAEYFSRLLQLRDSGLYRGNVRSAKLAVKRPFRATVVGQKVLSHSESRGAVKPSGRKTPYPNKLEENSNSIIENRRAMIQNHLRKKKEIQSQKKQSSTETDNKPLSRSKLPTRSRSTSKSSSGKSQDIPEHESPDKKERRGACSEKEYTIQQKKTKISPRSRSSSISSSSSSTKEMKEKKRMDSIKERNAHFCGTDNINKAKVLPRASSEDVEMVNGRRSVQRSISVTQDKNGHYEVLYRPTPLSIGGGENKKNVSSEQPIDNNISVCEKDESGDMENDLEKTAPHQEVSTETSEKPIEAVEITKGTIDKEVSSAIAIQSLWRGRKERQKLTIASAKNNQNANELDGGNSSDIITEKNSNGKVSRDPSRNHNSSAEHIMEEVKSAIILQSLWRVRQARKNLKETNKNACTEKGIPMMKGEENAVEMEESEFAEISGGGKHRLEQEDTREKENISLNKEREDEVTENNNEIIPQGDEKDNEGHEEDEEKLYLSEVVSQHDGTNTEETGERDEKKLENDGDEQTEITVGGEIESQTENDEIIHELKPQSVETGSKEKLNLNRIVSQNDEIDKENIVNTNEVKKQDDAEEQTEKRFGIDIESQSEMIENEDSEKNNENEEKLQNSQKNGEQSIENKIVLQGDEIENKDIENINNAEFQNNESGESGNEKINDETEVNKEEKDKETKSRNDEIDGHKEIETGMEERKKKNEIEIPNDDGDEEKIREEDDTKTNDMGQKVLDDKVLIDLRNDEVGSRDYLHEEITELKDSRNEVENTDRIEIEEENNRIKREVNNEIELKNDDTSGDGMKESLNNETGAENNANDNEGKGVEEIEERHREEIEIVNNETGAKGNEHDMKVNSQNDDTEKGGEEEQNGVELQNERGKPDEDRENLDEKMVEPQNKMNNKEENFERNEEETPNGNIVKVEGAKTDNELRSDQAQVEENENGVKSENTFKEDASDDNNEKNSQNGDKNGNKHNNEVASLEYNKETEGNKEKFQMLNENDEAEVNRYNKDETELRNDENEENKYEAGVELHRGILENGENSLLNEEEATNGKKIGLANEDEVVDNFLSDIKESNKSEIEVLKSLDTKKEDASDENREIEPHIGENKKDNNDQETTEDGKVKILEDDKEMQNHDPDESKSEYDETVENEQKLQNGKFERKRSQDREDTSNNDSVEEKNVERQYHRSDTIVVPSDLSQETEILEKSGMSNEESTLGDSSADNTSHQKLPPERSTGDEDGFLSATSDEKVGEGSEKQVDPDPDINLENRLAAEEKTGKDLTSEGNSSHGVDQKSPSATVEDKRTDHLNEDNSSKRSEYQENESQSLDIALHSNRKKNNGSMEKFYPEDTENSGKRKKRSIPSDFNLNRSVENNDTTDSNEENSDNHIEESKAEISSSIPGTNSSSGTDKIEQIQEKTRSEGKDVEKEDKPSDIEEIEKNSSYENNTNEQQNISENERHGMQNDNKKVESKKDLLQENTNTEEVGNGKNNDILNVDESSQVQTIEASEPKELEKNSNESSDTKISDTKQSENKNGNDSEQVDAPKMVHEDLIKEIKISKLGSPSSDLVANDTKLSTDNQVAEEANTEVKNNVNSESDDTGLTESSRKELKLQEDTSSENEIDLDTNDPAVSIHENQGEVLSETSEKESAIRIQTIWRGFQARKKLKSLLEQSLAEESQNSSLSKKLSEDSVKDENENLLDTRNNNLSDTSEKTDDKDSSEIEDHVEEKGEEDTERENFQNSKDNIDSSMQKRENSSDDEVESVKEIQSALHKECLMNSIAKPHNSEISSETINFGETKDDNSDNKPSTKEDGNTKSDSDNETNGSSEKENYTDEEINAAKRIQITFRNSRKQPKESPVEKSDQISEKSSNSCGEKDAEKLEKKTDTDRESTEIDHKQNVVSFSDDEIKAATKIQSTFRNSRKKRSKPRLQDLDLNSDNGKEYLREVLKIQSAWRAYKVRKNIRDVENKISEIEIDSGNDVKSSIHLTDQEILKAVTKIQAGLRGYLTRKHFSNMREPKETLDRIKEESHSDYSRMNSNSSTDDQLLEILKQVEGVTVPDTVPDIPSKKEFENSKEVSLDHLKQPAVEDEISSSHLNTLEMHPCTPLEDAGLKNNSETVQTSLSTTQNQFDGAYKSVKNAKDQNIEDIRHGDSDETSKHVKGLSQGESDGGTESMASEDDPMNNMTKSVSSIPDVPNMEEKLIVDNSGDIDEVQNNGTTSEERIKVSSETNSLKKNQQSIEVAEETEKSDDEQSVGNHESMDLKIPPSQTGEKNEDAETNHLKIIPVKQTNKASFDSEGNAFPVRGSLKKSKAIDNLVELAEHFGDSNDPLERTAEKSGELIYHLRAVTDDTTHGEEKLASFEIPDEFELDTSETEHPDNSGISRVSNFAEKGEEKSTEKEIGSRRSSDTDQEHVNGNGTPAQSYKEELSDEIEKHENQTEAESRNGLDPNDEKSVKEVTKDCPEYERSPGDSARRIYESGSNELSYVESINSPRDSPRSPSLNSNNGTVSEKDCSTKGGVTKDKRPTLTDFMKKTLDFPVQLPLDITTSLDSVKADSRSDRAEGFKPKKSIQSRYEAATKIQSIYRGYAARKHVEGIKKAKDNTTEQKEDPDVLVDIGRVDQTQHHPSQTITATINPSGEIQQLTPEETILQKSQTHDIGTGTNGNVNMEGSQDSVPAGDEILTTETHQHDFDVGQASGDVESDAQSSFWEASTQDVLSNEPGVESECEMESTKRNNSTLRNKNMEAEAAIKIQAGFRGYKVRKELKMKDTPLEGSTRKTVRRKSSSCLTENQAKKQKENIDLQEKSAVKIQAGIRGFLVRMKVKKPQKSQ